MNLRRLIEKTAKRRVVHVGERGLARFDFSSSDNVFDGNPVARESKRLVEIIGKIRKT